MNGIWTERVVANGKEAIATRASEASKGHVSESENTVYCWIPLH